jgi:hypothetical protein
MQTISTPSSRATAGRESNLEVVWLDTANGHGIRRSQTVFRPRHRAATRWPRQRSRIARMLENLRGQRDALACEALEHPKVPGKCIRGHRSGFDAILEPGECFVALGRFGRRGLAPSRQTRSANGKGDLRRKPHCQFS